METNIASDFRTRVFRLWPIPPVEERRNGLIPIQWIHPAFRLNLDSEYLCYRTTCIALAINLILTMLLYADYYFQTGIFVSADDFQSSKLILTLVLQHLLLVPTAVLSILLYLRLRLGMDIKRDTIPISIMRGTIIASPRNAWIRWSIFGILVCLAIPTLSHHAVDRFVIHFHGEDSLFVILLMQLPFQVGATTAVPLLFASTALLFEKSIRFFSEAQRDLETRPMTKFK